MNRSAHSGLPHGKQRQLDTHFPFLDARVDGVQQVGSVLLALGQFGQFLADQLALMVAHHPLKCRIHILRRETEGYWQKQRKE